MGVLRLAVLGPPEVFHDESRLTFALRKAQALLWPDSAPHDERTALRNALALLRTLLANPEASPAPHSHLLSERDLLGLDQHAPCELDLAVVQQAWKEAQLHSTLPAEPQRAALVAQCQQALALVRGPFLDGFWLGEDAPFDEWVQQQLVDLGRDLQLSQITLQPLSQEETLQLLQALVGEVRERVTAQPAPAGAGPAPARETKLWALGDFLFAHTGGQPLYLLETLRLLREREWLVPRLGTDGVFRLELAVEMATVVAQEQTRHELLPPSLRTLIRARLSKLTQPARQLVMASAVLGKEVSAQHLWQVAGLGVQAGLEALEEAVKSGMLCEEPAGAGRPGGYGFAYKLVRDVVYTELGGGVAVPLAAARLGAAASREREDLRTGLSGALDLRDRGGLSLQRTSRDEAMAVFAVRPTTSSREGILLERRSQ